MKLFKLAKKKDQSTYRYPIAISLMISSSSILSTLIFRLAIILMKKMSEHTNIPASTQLGLPSLRINSSESLDNWYKIDK